VSQKRAAVPPHPGREGQAGGIRKETAALWWMDLFWGFWNGLTAWIVLIVHGFGGFSGVPIYNAVLSGNWYDFGFLVGAGSPFLGALGTRSGNVRAAGASDRPRGVL
jgi:hypothetical protein